MLTDYEKELLVYLYMKHGSGEFDIADEKESFYQKQRDTNLTGAGYLDYTDYDDSHVSAIRILTPKAIEYIKRR
jgi:hypothetical protein